MLLNCARLHYTAVHSNSCRCPPAVWSNETHPKVPYNPFNFQTQGYLQGGVAQSGEIEQLRAQAIDIKRLLDEAQRAELRARHDYSSLISRRDAKLDAAEQDLREARARCAQLEQDVDRLRRVAELSCGQRGPSGYQRTTLPPASAALEGCGGDEPAGTTQRRAGSDTAGFGGGVSFTQDESTLLELDEMAKQVQKVCIF